MLASLNGRFVELDFIQEAALESFIHILLQISGGYEDAIEHFHLLQDDVLDTVLHLVHSTLCPVLTNADDGVSLVEQQDGRHLGSLHLFTIAVKEGLDILLALPHPLALDARHIHHHDAASRLTCQLIDGLRLTRAWSAIKQTGETVAEAATYSFIVASLVAGFQGLRKAFRNRGKTPEDFAAEKEAAKINKTCGALEEMLLEYIRSAQDGIVEQEALEELIAVLDEMHGYLQAGKLQVPGMNDLTDIRVSIENYTASLAENRSVRPAPKAKPMDADEFILLRDQLILQKELLFA